jgi:hypothetical protein
MEYNLGAFHRLVAYFHPWPTDLAEVAGWGGMDGMDRCTGLNDEGEKKDDEDEGENDPSLEADGIGVVHQLAPLVAYAGQCKGGRIHRQGPVLLEPI